MACDSVEIFHSFYIHFKIRPDSVNITFLPYLHSPCLSGKLLRFPVGHRCSHPLIKHTLTDAVMQTLLGMQAFSETERQTRMSSPSQAVKWGLGGQGCESVCVCLSRSLCFCLILSLIHTHTQKQPSGCHQEKTTYLSAVSNKTPNSANTPF